MTSLSLVPASFANSNNVTGFDVINVAWGTPANSTSAAPGDRNVPVSITLEYVFPNTATSVQGLLDLPNGLTLYNGSSTDFASTSQITPTGTIFELTFDSIYLASDLALGSYSATLDLSWTAAGYAYVLNQTTTVTLYVQGRPQIAFSSPSASLIPGEVNNVSISIYNSGSGPASNISISTTSQTAGVLNTVQQIQSLPAGTNSVFTLDLFIPKSASGSVISLAISAGYKDPYGNSGSASQTIQFYGSYLNEPALEFTVTPHTLSAGQINNVTVTITNTGSGSASNIVTTISGSQGITSVSDFPKIASLSPGASSSITIEIYPSSTVNSPVTLTFSSNYVDSYGVAGSASQGEGFQIVSATVNTSLSITTLSNSVTSGLVSKVSLLVENIGDSTVYAPSYAITVSQPLVVAGNSTFASTGTSIAPGQSEIYTTYLTASPGSSSGIYSATISVSFTDQYGTRHDQSSSVAIMLSGSVELVIQNEAVSQDTGTITVTGSILNEGSAAAYYASVSGYLNGSKPTGTPDYVGEIDTNSPVPFTATIPFQAEGNSVFGNITILIQYKNSLGQMLNSSSSEIVQLKSISQIISSSSTTTPNTTNQNGFLGLSLLELVILFTAVLVVAGTGTVVAVRRRKQPRVTKEVSQVA